MNKDDHKAAFLILEAAEQGRMVEFVSQNVASYIHSGNLDSDDIRDLVVAMLGRTTELVADPSEIWWPLLPGGEQGAPSAPIFQVYEVSDPGSVDKELLLKLIGMLDQDQLIELVEELQAMPNVGRPERVLDLEAAEMDDVKNIILTGATAIRPDDQTTLYCDGCEVFLDEHKVQWVKFVPKNGPNNGREHCMRTDGIHAIVTT